MSCTALRSVLDPCICLDGTQIPRAKPLLLPQTCIQSYKHNSPAPNAKGKAAAAAAPAALPRQHHPPPLPRPLACHTGCRAARPCWQ